MLSLGNGDILGGRKMAKSLLCWITGRWVAKVYSKGIQ